MLDCMISKETCVVYLPLPCMYFVYIPFVTWQETKEFLDVRLGSFTFISAIIFYCFVCFDLVTMVIITKIYIRKAFIECDYCTV